MLVFWIWFGGVLILLSLMSSVLWVFNTRLAELFANQPDSDQALNKTMTQLVALFFVWPLTLVVGIVVVLLASAKTVFLAPRGVES